MDYKHSVLVVDDEPNITELVCSALKFEGFEVDSAKLGTEAITKITEKAYDAVILDVMLPDMLGIHVCERIRTSSIPTAVLFLTARDAVDDKIEGLTAGGDDYMTKPFSLDELVARLKAILRRTGSSTNKSTTNLYFADLQLDDEAHEVSRGDQLIDLTATEFNLLRFLMQNARKVVSKAQILEYVWDIDYEGDPNLVETYISYLRKKIDYIEPHLIQTVRGVGYCLRLPRMP